METIKGFKGFDKNLKCKDFQYEIGQRFSINETPKLCSRGFHFSLTLKDAMIYYSNTDGNRYCEIIALGDIVHSANKYVTNLIEIVREVSQEEICATMEGINLGLLKNVSDKGGIICGSLALKLQDYDLGRPIKDIDFIFANNSSVDDVFKNYSNAALGSCIHENKNIKNRRAYYDKDYNFTYDVFVMGEKPYKEVSFYGIKVKVSDPLSVWNKKIEYAVQGHVKHYNDFMKFKNRLDIHIIIREK